MNRRALRLALFALALACLAPRALDLVPRARARQPDAIRAPHVAGELLVKIDKTSTGKSAAAADSVREAHARLGARVVEELSQGDWQLVKLPEGLSVGEAVKVYGATAGVAAAQPNYVYSIDKTPNDPRFAELYGLAKISAPSAWDTTTGSASVVVAVIDTGVKYTHEDLAANVWTNPGETGADSQGRDKATNGIDDDGDGFIDDVHGWDFMNNDADPSDDNGHGTHCAGTIGAVGQNATGVAGVNWNVSMIAVKTHDASGNSTSAKVVAAFNYVTLLKSRGTNVRVTSNSWGGAPEAPAYDQALAGALSAAAAADILNVFAAGNANTDTDAQPFYPASYQVPNLISVAASDQNDNRAGFSNYGAASVDLAAPGVGILSTISTASNYATLSGTSMAAPHVAGAAALVAAADPRLSAASLKATLLNTVDVLSNWTNDPATGKRLTLTGGRLNVARAVAAPTACAYSLGASGASFASAGGNSSFAVSAQSNCDFGARSNAAWITLGASANGVGYTVAPNPDAAARAGTITAAGLTYTVTQSAAPSIQFADTTTTAGEGTGSARIVVTRAGDASATSSAVVRTVDDARAVRCDDTSSAPGVAFARCDYATVAQTLVFAPGETQKIVTVPLVDDTFVEPDETVQLAVSKVAGASLGPQAAATLVIKDNDQPGEPNPILSTPFFVRQQYLDFLSREPEPDGFAAWVATLNNCRAGDTSCDRVSVSAAFFGSQEFRLKGFFVFKFYKVALGRMPTYAEMVSDMSSVTGDSTPDLVAKKAAFTTDFAQRPDFRGLYDLLDTTAFVAALAGRYNLQSITTPDPATPDDPSSKLPLTRADLVGRLNAGAITRAQVLRAVADSDQVSQAELNPAFVAMQYFGYLRRDPDQGGYADWLRTINANPSDTRSMVNGFVNSVEYRLRFGPP
jgi:subtilisin family serine protease